MTGQHAVADADILAEAGRSALERDAIIVGVGQQATHHHIVTAINIERVVVVVIAIVHLDILYPHAVASQIVLHPATGVPESDAPDGDILALDKTDEMGTGDAFVVPRQLLEGTAPAIDGAIAINRHMAHLVGIDQLDGGGLGAQRHVVGLHGTVVLEVGAAIEGGTVFEIEMDIGLEHNGAGLIVASRHHHPATACLGTVVDGLLEGLG